MNHPAFDRSHLRDALAAQAGLPAEWLHPDGTDGLLARLGESLREALIGQEAAITHLCRTLSARVAERALQWRAATTSLSFSCDRRPLACLLACGPTGVGKTETARLLAHAAFGGALIALNATDVGPEAPHGVATWVGSPPGYVGYNEGGVLTNGLRQHSACVVLIDELEKAAPDAVQNVLLPLMGEGTVTDRSTGETLWASECVVFATSNLPAASLTGGTAPAPEPAPALRREVIGRFHAVLNYRELAVADLREIWLRELQSTARLAGLGPMDLDDSAQAWLDPELTRISTGARGAIDHFRVHMLPALLAVGPPRSCITADGGGLRLQ